MELTAKYHVETDLPILKAAEAIAAEQSTGSWTDVRGQDNPLAARVISAQKNEVEIGFPEELFRPGKLPSTSRWWQETSRCACRMSSFLRA
jgi:ribulose-bisphosphate carboxylase large chain